MRAEYDTTKAHKPHLFKKGCLFWIIIILFSSLFIISLFLYYFFKTREFVPKEVFYAAEFDGFLQVNIQSKIFNQVILDVIKNADFKDTDIKIEAKDIDTLNYYITKLFYPKIFVFFNKENAEPQDEQFLCVVGIKRLPNLIKKAVYEAIEKKKIDIAEVKNNQYSIWTYSLNKDDKLFISVFETNILISNNEEILNKALSNRKTNVPLPNSAEPQFKALISNIKEASLISGFFINKNDRFKDFLTESFNSDDPVSDIIRTSVNFENDNADLLGTISSVAVNTEYTEDTRSVVLSFMNNFKKAGEAEKMKNNLDKILIIKTNKETVSKIETKVHESGNNLEIKLKSNIDEFKATLLKSMKE